VEGRTLRPIHFTPLHSTHLREPEGAPVKAKQVVLRAHALRVVARRHRHWYRPWYWGQGRRRLHPCVFTLCGSSGSSRSSSGGGLGVRLLLGLGGQEQGVDVLGLCVCCGVVSECHDIKVYVNERLAIAPDDLRSMY
jgi:hypothetical protein